MMDRPFAALLDLITFDQEVRVAYQEIEQLKGDIASLKTQEEQWREVCEAAKSRVTDLSKEVSQLELRMREWDEQEQAKKTVLDNISDYREYKAIKTEIDGLQRAQHEAEEQLLGVYNRLEGAQKDLGRQQTEYDERMKELSTTIGEKESKIATLEGTVREHDEKRPAKEELVPDEWREKYTAMRLRVPDPVINVVDGGCGACFQSVTQQEMIRLRRSALVQCQGCFRLMYLQEAMSEAPSDEEPASAES